MQSFFHGWRRKAGVVTLVMACVLASAWLRSITYEDKFRLSRHSTSEVLVISAHQHVIIAWQNGASAGKMPFWTSGRLPEHGWVFTAEDNVTIYLGLYGSSFGYNTFVTEAWVPKTIDITTLHFPYWIVVIPLTLLSAYLLLWKPRKRPDSGPKF